MKNFKFTLLKADHLLLAVSLIAASLSPLLSRPAVATSPGENGYIASYGGDTVTFIDPTDGSSQIFEQNTDYTTSFFDVTSDGQNFMTMFQSYNGTYHNSALQIWSAQTGQAVDFDFNETYYNTMSPDGTKIAFYEIDDNYMSIYDMSTSSVSRMTIPSYMFPVWSPDSKRIAYLQYDWNNFSVPSQLAFSHLETGAYIPVPNSANAAPLDWSPDGTKIAFRTPDQNTISIYDINTKATTTSNPGNLLDATHSLRSFIWSPDMQQIALTICDTGNNCTLNVGGVDGNSFDTYPSPSVYSGGTKWVPNSAANSVYRFWSQKHQHHFYTASYMEAISVMLNYPNDVWKYEGIAYKASAAGNCAPDEQPVYRFWSDRHSSHFFTISAAEKQHVIDAYPDNIWRYEGEAFCAKSAPATGYQPVYRFWSDRHSSHFYTTSAAEKDWIITHYPANVWRFEGTAYYVQ